MADRSEKTYVAFRSRDGDEWFVHPDLRSRMVAEAAERGLSLSGLTVLILSEHFGVPYTPKPKTTQPDEDRAYLMFRLPEDLDRAIGAAYGSRKSEAIRKILSGRYSLLMPARRKQTRRRTAA